MKITNTEIVAVAEGSADTLTERRVLAAALLDPALERRLMLLRTLETEDAPPLEPSTGRMQRLQESMEIGARQVGREFLERNSKSKESPDWIAALGQKLRRKLSGEGRRIALSALAPALAASEESLRVQREVFEMDGVRIEIHQLPEKPPKLRFFVDASLAEGFLAEGVSAATLALQEEGILELWLVTVPLNAQGRGVWELPAPAVRGAVGLLGVALVGE